MNYHNNMQQRGVGASTYHTDFYINVIHDHDPFVHFATLFFSATVKMQKGWFDLFRENGGPTLYSHANRTHGQYFEKCNMKLCLDERMSVHADFAAIPTVISLKIHLIFGTNYDHSCQRRTFR